MLSYDTDLMRLMMMDVARPDGTDRLTWNYYGYTENGLLSGVADWVDFASGVGYSYNYRNQLSAASRNGTSTDYSLDQWGNLTGFTGSSPATFSYAVQSGTQVPATNRLSSMTQNYVTTNFTYDNAGNMTGAGSTTYAWDAANRLKNVNGGSLGSYQWQAGQEDRERDDGSEGRSLSAERGSKTQCHLGSGRKRTKTR